MTFWHDGALHRTRLALKSARAAPDKLALMRTLTWLEGGRTQLTAEMREATSDDDEFFRFGLRSTGNGGSLRLLEESVFPWWPDLHVQTADRRGWTEAAPDGVLCRYTANANYRSASQKAAVRALMTQPPGSGLMISMPTGGGKSLMFQIAALHGRGRMPGAAVIVITPTIALALDHERTLGAMPGLEGSKALTGDLTSGEAASVMDAFRRGEVPILLLSPEKALQDSVVNRLVEAASDVSAFAGLDARLTHLFVDEAHIVESWGRSFRPDFQRLPSLLSRLRAVNSDVRLVLLSATLTPSAKRVLRGSWRLGGDWLELNAKVSRREHDVVVASFQSVAERTAALDWVVDRAPRPVIIYTTEVAAAEVLYGRLSGERGYGRAALFTGATPSSERRRILDRWAEDELDIVVATSAFGMGVDKAGVRSVIHACLPEGPSRWYQEIGRAGRDGGQALSVTLFTDMVERDDVDQAMDIATSGWLSLDLAKSRWQAVLRAAAHKRWEAGRLSMDVDLDALRDGLGPRSSDYNRLWNMALLTLMQRAGSIRMISVQTVDDEPTGRWEIEVIDASLLDGSGTAAWQRVLAVRDQERAEAIGDVSPFIELMRHPSRRCVNRAVFEMIEAGSYAPPCGRCPSCRAEGLPSPPMVESRGLEICWDALQPYEGPLPAGVILVEPSDTGTATGLSALLRRLIGVGVEQFIVSEDQAGEVARALGEAGSSPGLVMTHEDWTGGVRIAGMATAMLIPDSGRMAETMIMRFLDWSTAHPTLPAALIGERERVLAGRRVDQFTSRYAPVTESMLDAWSISDEPKEQK